MIARYFGHKAMLATWGCTTFSKPTLDLQFVGATSLDNRITFSRASTATFFNSSGVLSTAASGAARFDYNPSTLAAQGLLIEEQRTNSIRNNTMQGAVAGTPGTAPTNWVMPGAINGLTQEIVGVGTEKGVTYIDIRYSGTTSAASSHAVSFEAANQISASSGQTWSRSVFAKIVAGSKANLTNIFHNLQGRNAANTAFTETFSTDIAPSLTETFTRFSTASTLADANTAFARSQISFSYNNGVAIDITLRIGLPQLELGAFATSVIPTTTTALTRNADVASMTGTNFSSWYNAAQGTVVFAATRSSSGQPYLWMFSNGATATERYYLRYVSSQYQFIPRAAGVDGAGAFVASAGSLVTASHATAYVSNQNRISSNGGQDGNSTQTVTSQPTSLNTLYLGSFTGTAAFLNGTIQRLAFYPISLPNSTLQALTA